MTARISKDFTFQSAIHIDNNFCLNSYKVTLWMDVMTESIDEQNIAMDRIKYFIDEGLDNCVLVHSGSEKSVIENYIKAGIKICTLPEEPFDQVVGAVIMCKINAITEGKLFVTEIKIRSRICDDVEFYICSDETVEFLATNEPHWYTQSNMANNDWLRKSSKKEKIVELKREILDWAELGLGWNNKHKLSEDSDVVYLNLDK
jgi:hypothetical protein